MSSDELKEIIQVAQDFTATSYYALGTAAILFYDYLLTLADEVEYVWSGRKSWVFVLFIVNRYLPLGYQLWTLIAHHRLLASRRLCDTITLTSVLMYVGCTVLAQVSLSLRIYAVTGGNRITNICIGVITASQLALGIYFIALMAVGGAQKNPTTQLGTCNFMRHRPVELGFPIISLVYDLLAFLVIMYTAFRSGMCQFKVPSLFRIIARDATQYFLVIFTSHLVLELTQIFGRSSIQLLPAVGNVVFLPMMVARLFLSLRKASATQQDAWNFGERATATSVRFSGSQGPGVARDGIRLDTVGGADTKGLRAEHDAGKGDTRKLTLARWRPW